MLKQCVVFGFFEGPSLEDQSFVLSVICFSIEIIKVKAFQNSFQF